MRITTRRRKAEHWSRPARPASVPDLRHAVAGFAAACGLSRERIEDISLAVTEAVSNAVLHAYSDRPPRSVEVRAEARPEDFVLSIVDHGGGLRPRGRRSSPGFGFGLPMMGRLADRMEIIDRGEGEGVEVVMGFERQAQA